MSNSSKESLTSCLLQDHNWLLWRREIVMGMKRLHAYKIMTGTEPRPDMTAQVAPPQPSPNLSASQSRLAQATANYVQALREAQSHPEQSEARDVLTEAQIFLSEATARYQLALQEPTTTTSTPTEVDTWDDRHDKAHHLLLLALSPTFKTMTLDCADLPTTWTALQAHFEGKAAADIISAENELERLTIAEHDNILETLNKIRTIRNILNNAGAPIADNKLFLTIIRKLPSRMNTIRDTILYGPEERKTFQILEQTLTSYAKNNPPPQPRHLANNAERRAYCSHCRMTGHTFTDCRTKDHNCKLCGKRGHRERRCRTTRNSAHSGHERRHTTNFAYSVFKPQQQERWIVDTGASTSISSKVPTSETTTGEAVTLANGESVPVTGKGSVRPLPHLHLSTVLEVPSAHRNLLSIGKACDDDDIDLAIFDKSSCRLFKSDRLIATALKTDGLYILRSEQAAHQAHMATLTLERWHERLAHSPLSTIRNIITRKRATGIVIDKIQENSTKTCDACQLGKATRLPFGNRDPERRVTTPGRVLHVDICGPMPAISTQGCKYAMPIVDEFSRFTTTCFLNRKSDAADMLLLIINQYENFTGQRVHTIQADNGGEFMSKYLHQQLENKGIRMQTTIPYTPEQNGLVERMNRTLVEKARTMLHHAGLPHEHWQSAIATATHITNRLPTKANNNQSPFELWFGRTPDLSHVRVFGCRAFAHIPAQKRSKFDAKAHICTFLGYASNQKGYELMIDDTGTFVMSRDVTFDEHTLPHRAEEKGEQQQQSEQQSDVQQQVPSATTNQKNNPISPYIPGLLKTAISLFEIIKA